MATVCKISIDNFDLLEIESLLDISNKCKLDNKTEESRQYYKGMHRGIMDTLSRLGFTVYTTDTLRDDIEHIISRYNKNELSD